MIDMILVHCICLSFFLRQSTHIYRYIIELNNYNKFIIIQKDYKVFQKYNVYITKDFETIFDTNESDNKFTLQRRSDAIIASFSS